MWLKINNLLFAAETALKLINLEAIDGQVINYIFRDSLVSGLESDIFRVNKKFFVQKKIPLRLLISAKY